MEGVEGRGKDREWREWRGEGRRGVCEGSGGREEVEEKDSYHTDHLDVATVITLACCVNPVALETSIVWVFMCNNNADTTVRTVPGRGR